MTSVRQLFRRHKRLWGGAAFTVFTALAAVLIPLVVSQLNDDPPGWLRPLTDHAGVWLVGLLVASIVIGLVKLQAEWSVTAPANQAARSATPAAATELAATPTNVKVRVGSEYPMVKLPDGTARVGERHIVVFVINTGERTVTIRKWGFILPGEHVVRGTSSRQLDEDTELPHRLRPGDEEARFSTPASVLRRLAADEHVAPADIRAYVQLEGDTRVLADTGVPLKVEE